MIKWRVNLQHTAYLLCLAHFPFCTCVLKALVSNQHPSLLLFPLIISCVYMLVICFIESSARMIWTQFVDTQMHSITLLVVFLNISRQNTFEWVNLACVCVLYNDMKDCC